MKNSKFIKYLIKQFINIENQYVNQIDSLKNQNVLIRSQIENLQEENKNLLEILNLKDKICLYY